MSEEPEIPEEEEAQHLIRPTVPELDEILGKPFKVLDDGFAALIECVFSVLSSYIS